MRGCRPRSARSGQLCRHVTKVLQRQIIEKARTLLDSRGRWTRFRSARNRRGDACSPCSPDAVRFCAYGAILRAAYEITGDLVEARRTARSVEQIVTAVDGRRNPNVRLSHANDRAGHAAVLKMFDDAAERV
jgi:hypothetical protein